MARTRTLRLLGGALAIAALLAAGVGSALAADTTTTDLITTTTAPPATTQTVQETQTLQETQTVQETRTIPVRPATTTSTADDNSPSTPAWAWVLIALGIAGLIALIVWLARRGGSSELSPAERQRLVSAAVASWVGQGWAIESQTAESAVLAREGQRVVVSVDARGHVTSGPLGAPNGLPPQHYRGAPAGSADAHASESHSRGTTPGEASGRRTRRARR